MSNFPGRRFTDVFPHVRNNYSISRLAGLPRAALSINWILQLNTIKKTVVDASLEEGSTRIILRKRSSSVDSQKRFGHVLHVRNFDVSVYFPPSFKL